MDLSKSYTAAVRDILPNVDIVFDRFHVMALANKALDEVRKQQCRKSPQEDRQVLKGQRFLLLKNYASLSTDHSVRLKTLFEVNTPLFQAHAMKEQLRLFWNCDSALTGAQFLLHWISGARLTNIKPLMRLANTLESHLYVLF